MKTFFIKRPILSTFLAILLLSIPVKLNPDGWFNYDIVGELCWRGELAGKTLLLLNSGLGYGPVYWDFPYQSETYSFVQAAVAKEYATFNYHRMGIGASDHPIGLLINADVHAYIGHQIIGSLKAETDFSAVVTIGHSFGSAISVALAYFAGSIFDLTYFTSAPESRSRTFYVSANSDSNVHTIDEANKQTLTLGLKPMC